MKFKSKIDSISYIYNIIFFNIIIYIVLRSYFRKDIITSIILSISLILYEVSFFNKKYFIYDTYINIFNGIKSKKIYYVNIINYQQKISKTLINNSIYSVSKHGVEIVYNNNGKKEIIFISPKKEAEFLEVLYLHK